MGLRKWFSKCFRPCGNSSTDEVLLPKSSSLSVGYRRPSESLEEIVVTVQSALVDGNYELARTLMSDVSVHSVDKFKRTPLHYAVVIATKQERKEMIDLCLSFGASLFTKDMLGLTPVHRACLSGFGDSCKQMLGGLQKDLALQLLKEKTKPSKVGSFAPVQMVLFPSKTKTANDQIALLRYFEKIGGSEALSFDPPLLHTAARFGNFAAVDFLLSHGEDVNAVDSFNGDTALHIAVKYNQFDVCDLLSQKSVFATEQGVRNKEGTTALRLAKNLGRSHLVPLIVQDPRRRISLGNSEDKKSSECSCDRLFLL